MVIDQGLIRTAIKWGGLANVLGGLFVAIAYVLHPHHASPEVLRSSFWLWVHIAFAASLQFGIFGLVALIAQHGQNSGPVGLIGFIMALTSLTFIFGLNFFETFINPVIAAEAPDFAHKYGAGETIGLVAIVFPITGVLFMAGYLCLCGDMLRSQSLPRGSLILTMVGVLVFGAGLSGFLPMIIVQVGSVMFGVGLAWLGVGLWSIKEIQQRLTTGSGDGLADK